jgi:hypothetical protein
MKDAVQEIRIRAEILQHRAQTQHPQTLERFRSISAFDPAHIRRRDCLFVIAKEMGFLNWPHAKRVLSGEETEDFGGTLCPRRCSGHFNLWYKTHTEADAVRRTRGGYLLAFRRQFLVVERHYIETLGLDPDDPDWNVLEFDWTRNADNGAARARLYSKLIAMLPPESES